MTPDVLIPRPETEFVVVELLDRIAETAHAERPLRVADIGTGSGILAVCAAKHLPNCRVVAVDISPRALEVARRNAEEHGVAGRIEFLEGDLLDAVPAGEPFDFIISTPPTSPNRNSTSWPPKRVPTSPAWRSSPARSGRR